MLKMWSDAVLSDVFLNPPREFSPIATWWWSGDALDLQRMRWQMQRMAEGGVYNLLILNLAPRGPWAGSIPDNPRFFSEEWWAIFCAVCAYAQELDMHIWVYDQFGFSSANLQGGLIREAPELSGLWLDCVETVIEGPVTLKCPQGGQPLTAAAIPVDENGKAVAQPIPLALTNGRLEWSGPVLNSVSGRVRLRLFYAERRSFDYLNAQAAARLIDVVHGELDRRVGAYLGNVIAGTFQDEMEGMPTWTGDFAQQFIRRRGYDLLPRLTALFEGDDAEAGKVRCDFQAVREELAEEAFFQPLAKWHTERNMICGMDQQHRNGDPKMTTHVYADYMRTQRWFSAPGSDHGGETKIHSSLAHLYNQPGVWLEAFHSSGWGGTLEETFDWLLGKLRQGATLYSPHAVYYSTHGGWWEWAPPSTCWRQPYWRHHQQFAQAVARLASVLSLGHHICDIGLLYPTSTIQAGLSLRGATPATEVADSIYHALVGRANITGQDITHGVFDEDRRDFDILDDASVQRAEVGKGSLCIGAEKYKVVVLPGCVVLEDATAVALRAFVLAGGLLVAVGALPEQAAGLKGDSSAIRQLRELFAVDSTVKFATKFAAGAADAAAESSAQAAGTDAVGAAIFVERPEDVPAALARLPRQVDAPLPTLFRAVDGQHVLFIPGAYPFGTHFNPGRANGYSFSPDNYVKSVTVTVRGVKSLPQLWNPITGDICLLQGVAHGDSVTFAVPFTDTPAALLVWPKNIPATGKADKDVDEADLASQPCCHVEETEHKVVYKLGDWWKVQLEQTLDNSSGDLDKPNYSGPPPIQTWTCKHRSEAAGEDGLQAGWHIGSDDHTQWHDVHATFGIYAWTKGPCSQAELPPPLSVAECAPTCGNNPNEGLSIGSLQTDGWTPVEYSLSRGIYKDPIHYPLYGPKGYVPEEFIRFGKVKPDEAAQCRTSVWAPDEQSLYLAVNASAMKRVWVNGEELCGNSSADLWLAPVTLRRGNNVIEFRVVADYAITDLRAYWALVRQPERFTRPEWMTAPGKPHKGSRSVFTYSFDIPFAVKKARVQLPTASAMPCVLKINGLEITVQTGRGRIQWHDIENFRQGRNEIRIEIVDPGIANEAMFDGVITGSDGQELQIISSGAWTARRDNGEPQPPRLGKRVAHYFRSDLRGDTLWRRPHPLPAAEWLEDYATDDTVFAAVPDAFPNTQRVEWLQWMVPAGAITAHVPVAGEMRCFVDSVETEVVNGKLTFTAGSARPRLCVARIVPDRGRTGGGMLTGPITYCLGPGEMQLGDWCTQGLAAYSGGVRYCSVLNVEQLDALYMLDLGRVRGTAELWLNGRQVGVRMCSPYRFDVSEFLQLGHNNVEVIVFNTLAPYLQETSPTPFVFPGQEVSGMFGPVQLLGRSIR